MFDNSKSINVTSLTQNDDLLLVIAAEKIRTCEKFTAYLSKLMRFSPVKTDKKTKRQHNTAIEFSF